MTEENIEELMNYLYEIMPMRIDTVIQAVSAAGKQWSAKHSTAAVNNLIKGGKIQLFVFRGNIWGLEKVK